MIINIKVSNLLNYPVVEYVTSTLKKLLDFVADDFLGVSKSGESGKNVTEAVTETATDSEAVTDADAIESTDAVTDTAANTDAVTDTAANTETVTDAVTDAAADTDAVTDTETVTDTGRESDVSTNITDWLTPPSNSAATVRRRWK